MLYRKIESLIEAHLKSESKRILLIDGARQVGKTYIIRYVGNKLFENFIEINMVEDSLGDRLFAETKTVEDFYLQVSMLAGNKMKSVFLWLRYEPVPPAMQQIPVDLPRCSSRQGSPDRMPVPVVRWLHRGKGKYLWTFSFCSNAHSFGFLLTAYNVPVVMLSAHPLRAQIPAKQGTPCACG